MPRLYKQGKTTEQRSEKVTATSVRKAAGSQGSWFEKKENKKMWLAIVTRSWDDSLWLGWCSHCCSLGKMSSKTILLLWVNTWTEIATARGSCYCYRVVFCRTYLPWSGRVIHSLYPKQDVRHSSQAPVLLRQWEMIFLPAGAVPRQKSYVPR